MDTNAVPARAGDRATGDRAAGAAVNGDAAAGAPLEGLARRFVAALVAKDEAALLALFGEEVDFRALTPSRVWGEQKAAAVVRDVISGKWFEPADVIGRVEAVEAATVASRGRLGYRLQLANPDGRFLVEQQAFLGLTDGKITWLRMMCPGFMPLAGRT